jgi:hypothetical protein
MLKKARFILIILSSFLNFVYAQNFVESNKNPLRRAESFFGLHFDFHATNNDKEIGKTFNAGTIDSMLALIKPDYIQVDCKGHPGISSYPTKVGNAAPGFIKDPLRIWRDETNKHGIGLFVHYSGVIDNEAVKKNPDWAAINRDRKISETNTSVVGPYVDRLLIPQLKELIDNYKIDGAWVDGESWALGLDYSKNMLDAFHKETGITSVPYYMNDKYMPEFRTFNRNAFRKYIAHYVDELHKYNPSFQITSNWAFSSFMPRPVDVNVDFISGDFEPNNSLYSGLFESRCIAPQGKPWDLMVWSFAHDNEGTFVHKSPVQLQQAAATVISMGGGFQIYSTQNRDASIKPWLFETLKSVSDFCRDRQPFTQNAKPVPQIALLYSTANFEQNSEPLYSSSGKIHDPLRGILNLLLDSQNAVEIMMEHHLEKKINKYPLVVIPETQYLTDDFKKVLLRYVNDGGNLLIIGAEATKMFAEQLNVEMKDTASIVVKNLAWKTGMAGLHGLYQPFVPKNSVETFGALYDEPDFRFQSSPAATITSYGKGEIAGVYFNIGKYYLRMNNPIYRNFINALIKKIFPNPKVEVKGSENLIMTVNRLDNKLTVNLINMSGPHANTRIARYDEIPSIGPLEVKIRIEKAPIKLTLQPENISLKYSYRNGELKTTVDRVYLHSILVVDQQAADWGSAFEGHDSDTSKAFELNQKALKSKQYLGFPNSIGTHFETKVICKQPNKFIGWPTITKTKSNELLVVFSGNRDAHECPYGITQMIRSKDNGKSWSAPETINNTPLDDRDAGILETKQGTLLVSWFTSQLFENPVFYNEKPEWLRHAEKISNETKQQWLGSWTRRSTNGGKSWEAPTKHIVSAPHGPIEMADGRLIYVGTGIINGIYSIGVEESTDDGQSWKLISTIEIPEDKSFVDFSEPHVVETADGKLVALFRYDPEDKKEEWHLHQSESYDGGKTWTRAWKTPIWGFPAHMIRLKNDWLLAVYGPRRKPYSERACISKDGGISWDIDNEVILSESSGDQGYPSSVELDDGSILTVYYHIEPPGEKTVLKATHWKLK